VRDLDLLIDAARSAGDIATHFHETGAKSWDKADGAGPVTEADLAVNDMLEDRLRSARPGYGWLSEESTDDPARLDAETVFIIDPIDGTRSFVDGARTWAHSLAIVRNGAVQAGVIYLPLRDMLFAAEASNGASLNGAPLTVSSAPDLDAAHVLATRPNMDAKHWKDAAGALIAAEAGGYVSDKTGAALRFNNPDPRLNGVIAAGRTMHDSLRARLAHA